MYHALLLKYCHASSNTTCSIHWWPPPLQVESCLTLLILKEVIEIEVHREEAAQRRVEVSELIAMHLEAITSKVLTEAEALVAPNRFPDAVWIVAILGHVIYLEFCRHKATDATPDQSSEFNIIELEPAIATVGLRKVCIPKANGLCRVYETLAFAPCQNIIQHYSKSMLEFMFLDYLSWKILCKASSQIILLCKP